MSINDYCICVLSDTWLCQQVAQGRGDPEKSSATVAKIIVKLICRYTNIHVVITDQGCEFMSTINEAICKRLNIDHCLTTAYHPQSNSQMERQSSYPTDGHHCLFVKACCLAGTKPLHKPMLAYYQCQWYFLQRECDVRNIKRKIV